MRIFPELSLSDTEYDIVADKLSDPAVKKYFHLLAYNTSQNIVMAEPGPGQSSEEHLRAIAGARGQLAVLETLLSLEKPADPS